MTQIVEVPGYGDVEFPDDMTDEQIAAAIQKNITHDQPKPAAQPFPDVYAGAGGFNPMLPKISGATDVLSKAAGADPTQQSSNAAIAVGPGDAALSAAANAGMMPVAGLAGIGQGLWNYVTPKSMNGPSAADRVAQVQGMAYQPHTQVGAGMLKTANAPLDLYGKGTNYAGEKAAEITGLPSVGAAIKTVGDIAPALLTDGVGRRGAAPKGRYTPDAAPSQEALSKAADAAYKRADDSGIAMKAESFDKMRAGLVSDLTKGGIDPTLHPKATAALKRVTEEQGPITLQKAETLRRIALDAEDTLEKSDARNAGKIVDSIDDYIDNLKDSDLISGEAKDASALKDARALYTRKRKAEDIARLMKRAELSPSGYENGLRIEFRSLAKNDRRFNRFNSEEKASILKVAKGGAVENALRLLGKAAPTGIVSGGLSSGAGFAFGGPVGAVALPAAGVAGRVGARAMTTRNAAKAGELMRRGPQQPASGIFGSPQKSSGVFGAIEPTNLGALRAQIQSLDAQVKRLGAMGPVAHAARASVEAELARLRQELTAAEARGVSP